MDIPVEKKPTEDTGNLRRYCPCGSLIWECPPGHQPKMREVMTCQGCGREHHNRPSPLYQLWLVKQGCRHIRRRWRMARRFITSCGGRI